MIFKGAVPPARQLSSQRNYNIFNLINGLSYMCLGETVIILLAVRLNCPDYIISSLGAMLYFGYLLLPLGKIVTARIGAAQSQATFWVLRNTAALLVALASPAGILGYQKIAIALLLVLLINLFPGLVIAIFDDTPGVVAEGTRYIHIVSIGFLLMAPMTVYNNLAIGVGRSTRAMVNSLTDSVFVRLPLCVILNYAAGLSLTGIYIGMAVSPLAAVLMGWWYFHRGNWRNEQLLKKS